MPRLLVLTRDGLGKDLDQIGTMVHLEDGDDASLGLLEEELVASVRVYEIRAISESASQCKRTALTVSRAQASRELKRDLLSACTTELASCSSDGSTSELADDFLDRVLTVQSLQEGVMVSSIAEGEMKRLTRASTLSMMAECSV